MNKTTTNPVFKNIQTTLMVISCCFFIATYSLAQCDSLNISTTIDTPILCFGDSTGAVSVNVAPTQTLLISEMGLEGSNFIEITNVSGVNLNVNGYYVATGNSHSTINAVNSLSWNLSGTVPPSWVGYRSDDTGAGANYWGNNLFYRRDRPGWILIFDANDVIVDALFWGWTAADIAGFAPTINGNVVTLGAEWTGDGVDAFCNDIYLRNTNLDSDNFLDWGCIPNTPGQVVQGILNLTIHYPDILWNTGAITNSISNLAAGNYNVTVNDIYGCPNYDSLVLTEPPSISATANTTDAICYGTNTGSATINATGGTGNLTIDWGGANPNSLPAGNTTYSITDSNACVYLDTVLINSPPAITATFTNSGNILCNGDQTAGAAATIAGGSPNYSYLWNTGSTSNSISGIGAGTYTIITTDANGCTFTDSTFISEPNVLLGQVSAADVPCFGDTVGGSASVLGIGGSPNYSYLWNNGATSATLSGIALGNYTVTTTDANGCSTINTVSISEPSVISTTLSATNVLCKNELTGSASIVSTGGIPGYNYSWNTGNTTNALSNLAAGTYFVSTSDANGCIQVDSIIISEPLSQVSASLNSNPVPCFGDASGTITATVQGGSPNYTYIWNTGNTTNALSNLPAGNYSLTTSDANGCTLSLTETVTEPSSALTGNINTTDLSCEDSLTSGAINISLTGGTPNYAYLWNTGATSAAISGLGAGTYSVIATDANGCTFSNSGTLQNSLQASIHPFVGQAPNNTIQINWNDVINIDAGNDQSSSGVSYFWEETSMHGNLNMDNPNAPNTTVNPQPTASANYTLLLTATSIDGCVDTGSINIMVSIEELAGLPSAFTPGNRDNVNDYFRPVGLDDQFILEFKIFNRWGNMVHDGTNTNQQWDGTFRGVEQASGVYLYILRYQLPYQEEEILKGEFTLIR